MKVYKNSLRDIFKEWIHCVIVPKERKDQTAHKTKKVTNFEVYNIWHPKLFLIGSWKNLVLRQIGVKKHFFSTSEAKVL